MHLPQTPTRHRASVIFCDIRGFTALFDERDPLEAVDFANAVLGELGSVVESSNGTIDKFTGDGFLAHFGVLGESLNSHAADACSCAIRLQKALVKINSTRHLVDQPVVQIGVGIHTGTIASGVISTLSKSEFTIFGSVVNTASRIESLTKKFAVDCLVSEVTFEDVQNQFKFLKMPAEKIRGLKNSPALYWLIPTNEP